MNKYKVTLCRADYRGQRIVWSDKVMSWPSIQLLIGELFFEYGRATDMGDAVIFKGKYLSAGGDMLNHSAELLLETMQE